jgi:cytochrome P450
MVIRPEMVEEARSAAIQMGEASRAKPGCNEYGFTQDAARHAWSDESEIDGIPIPNGAEMRPLVGAGNRGPRRWDRPDEFDIFRPRKQHLGFGFGMHICIGLNLARLEAQVWLEQALDKLPDYEVVGPIDYGRNFILRGPLAVHVAAR